MRCLSALTPEILLTVTVVALLNADPPGCFEHHLLSWSSQIYHPVLFSQKLPRKVSGTKSVTLHVTMRSWLVAPCFKNLAWQLLQFIKYISILAAPLLFKRLSHSLRRSAEKTAVVKRTDGPAGWLIQSAKCLKTPTYPTLVCLKHCSKCIRCRLILAENIARRVCDYQIQTGLYDVLK